MSSNFLGYDTMIWNLKFQNINWYTNKNDPNFEKNVEKLKLPFKTSVKW